MQIEKVSYSINWKNFKVGYSIFVPCLDDSSAKKEVLKVTKRLKIEVLVKTVIEDGVRGLRIWRM